MWWMCNILGLGEIIPEYVKCEDQQLQSAVVCVCVCMHLIFIENS